MMVETSEWSGGGGGGGGTVVNNGTNWLWSESGGWNGCCGVEGSGSGRGLCLGALSVVVLVTQVGDYLLGGRWSRQLLPPTFSLLEPGNMYCRYNKVGTTFLVTCHASYS